MYGMPWQGCIEEKRKGHFLYIPEYEDQITTCAKLLNIKYKFYGFSGELIESIN